MADRLVVPYSTMKMAAMQLAVFSVDMFRDFMLACQIRKCLNTQAQKNAFIHADTHSSALIILQCKDMEWLRWTDCTTSARGSGLPYGLCLLLQGLLSDFKPRKASTDAKISLLSPENR